MTPKELYEMTSISEDFNINILKGCYYDFFKEVGDEIWYIDSQDRIKVKTIALEKEDHRRFWRIVTVWLVTDKKDFPFMVCCNAGREGDDHSERYITDGFVFMEAVNYIKTKLLITEPDVIRTYHQEQDIPRMTEFYGINLKNIRSD